MNINDSISFELQRSDLIELKGVNDCVGDFSVTEFTDITDDETIDTCINNVEITIAKSKVYLFKGSTFKVSGKSLFLAFNKFKDFITYSSELSCCVITKNCIVSDLLIVQIVLSDNWLGGRSIKRLADSDKFDYYKFFYTDSDKKDCYINQDINVDLFKGYLGRSTSLTSVFDVINAYNSLSEEDKKVFNEQTGYIEDTFLDKLYKIQFPYR